MIVFFSHLSWTPIGFWQGRALIPLLPNLRKLQLTQSCIARLDLRKSTVWKVVFQLRLGESYLLPTEVLWEKEAVMMWNWSEEEERSQQIARKTKEIQEIYSYVLHFHMDKNWIEKTSVLFRTSLRHYVGYITCLYNCWQCGNKPWCLSMCLKLENPPQLVWNDHREHQADLSSSGGFLCQVAFLLHHVSLPSLVIGCWCWPFLSTALQLNKKAVMNKFKANEDWRGVKTFVFSKGNCFKCESWGVCCVGYHKAAVVNSVAI